MSRWLLNSAEALWKCRAVGNVENQTTVSHPSHRPWKTRPAFPTFPTAPTISLFIFLKNNRKEPPPLPTLTEPFRLILR